MPNNSPEINATAAVHCCRLKKPTRRQITPHPPDRTQSNEHLLESLLLLKKIKQPVWSLFITSNGRFIQIWAACLVAARRTNGRASRREHNKYVCIVVVVAGDYWMDSKMTACLSVYQTGVRNSSCN